MDQLTIFDVMSQFDENQANWVNVMNQFDKCTVVAYIPKEALSPTEIPYRHGSKEWDYHKKIWSDYCTAIWHHVGKWEIALDKLEKYRDEGKPCPMMIYRDNRGCFKPEKVVEYL